MIKIKDKSYIKKLLSKAILTSEVVVLNVTMISAYFNGGQILVTVNEYNEGLFEVITIPLITMWAIWTIFKGE